MKTAKLQSRSFAKFAAIPRERWSELKESALAIDNLKIGEVYQIASGAEAQTLFYGDKVHVRRLEGMRLVERRQDKLVFESQKTKRRSASIEGYRGGTVTEAPSGKITYFPSMFDKIAIFEVSVNVAQQLVEWQNDSLQTENESPQS